MLPPDNLDTFRAPFLAESLIRDIPDFPKPGILFKDITPVLQNPPAFQEIITKLAGRASTLSAGVTIVAGIESRGFIFGAPMAIELGASFVPIRKQGKLPYHVHSEEYALEYGASTLEIHNDAIKPGWEVVIVDDLLATGGTAAAAVRLVERCGGRVLGCLFVIELEFLSGRAALDGYRVESLIRY